ncbi:transporter [Ganoderma sinense ZZ0214-1]|uniref:Transporter n=1 Tax=Ganoderma sinense ZZ0214-1 TaxID=1077348 RepID=A0A2G8RU53_9APHY|nr:transporter [Ganoderma sinense ZZ0214-1]
MLNMCYMLVQMLYGIWTNSLGLISDAIHMAFDCMAIAVGLIASVMARWPPNERFTYGYGRIETLSGFANGIFLILISVFIVFEAIQRLLDPPEMNTSQLLLVSSLGLGVNLFGMFAMGGHHHSLEVKVDPLSHLHLHPAHARLQGEGAMSPITPNYKFGHDAHFETHHSSGHAPNLHDHSHVHDHGHEGHSDNMRGVFLHVMADTLGSVGVIVSTLLIQFYGWTGFDPIASLFIAVLIAASVIPLVIDTGKVLALDMGTKEKSIRDALATLAPIEGLDSYSAPRFWPKDSANTIGTIHIQVAPSVSSLDPGSPHSSARPTFARVDRVVERVDKLLRSRILGLEELTIQVEDSSSHYAD